MTENDENTQDDNVEPEKTFYQKSTLQEFQCHKKVKALQIAKIEKVGSGLFELHSGDENQPIITVSESYMSRHSAVVGGYYVLYADGYQSYSPADAFEEGYSKIDQ